MSLSTIFSNQANTRVIQTLASCDYPLHLRLLSSLSGCGVRSTERALAHLHRTRVIMKTRSERITLYSLNVRNPYVGLLKEMCSLESRYRLVERAAKEKSHPAQVFKFINETNRYLSQFKRI